MTSQARMALKSSSHAQWMAASGHWKQVEKNLDSLGQTSLQSILTVFDSGINEEQAWAICFQAAKSLSKIWAASKGGDFPSFANSDALNMHTDGSVTVSTSIPTVEEDEVLKYATSQFQLVSCLGYAVYQALDHGLQAEQEVNLSEPLNTLINNMTTSGEFALDEEDEGFEGPIYEFSLAEVMEMAASHLGSPSDARLHYKAVCRALVSEAVELVEFLKKIKSSSQRVLLQNTESDAEEIAELGKEDWARMWIQVIRELRNGVKLKHVSENDVDRPLYEFALTPYEILMDDIRSKRWNLNKVLPDQFTDAVDGGKKDAHDIILDFIRSRPPLAPAESRKLNPLPESSVTPRDKLMEELNQGESITERLKPVPKAMPVTAEQNGLNASNQKKVLKADISILLSNELEESDEEIDDQDDDAFLEELYRNRLKSLELETSPRHVPSSMTHLSAPEPQKKKITPDADLSPLSPLVATSTWAKAGMEVLEYVPGPKAPVGCLASDLISLGSPLVIGRRHSITICESCDATCTLIENRAHRSAAVTPNDSNGARRRRSGTFSRANGHVSSTPNHDIKPSPSMLSRNFPSLKDYGVRHPLECMSLTVKEVMHIRFVNTKAELESSPLPPHQLEDLEKGRVCFTCRKTKFSFFGPWSTACKLCKRVVCTRCVSKMRVPTEHFDSVPVYTLSPLSPEEIKEVLLPYESTGSEPGTPLLSRKDAVELRHLRPPKVVESMMAERRAERKRREEEEKTPPPAQLKSSDDLEADEILRQVLGEDEDFDSEDVFSPQSRWSQPKGHFKISIEREEAARAAANGLLHADSDSSSRDPLNPHRGEGGSREPRDPPMVKLSLKQRLERAKHILAHDPDKAIRGPLMNVCSDCKLMVCNIIRASRAMLAISQRGRQAYLPESSDRPGVTRHPRHLDATSSSSSAAAPVGGRKNKAKLHLDLQPVY